MRTPAIGVVLPLQRYVDAERLERLMGSMEDVPVEAVFFEELPYSELDPIVTVAHMAQGRDIAVFGIMVSSSKGRAPSVLAKQLSGLDVVSGGRTRLVIGDLDAQEDAASEDFARAFEGVQLISMMVQNDETTFSGRFSHVEQAWNTPRDTRDIPGFANVSLAMTPMHLAELLLSADRPPEGVVIDCDGIRESPGTVELLDNLGDRGGVARVGWVMAKSSRSDTLDDARRALPHVEALLIRFRELPLGDELARWVNQLDAIRSGETSD